MENIITLYDGEKELRFEFLDLVEYDGEQYVVLAPVEDDNEVVILRFDGSDDEADEDSYSSVEDEEILLNVFNIFKEKFINEFNFG